MGKVAVWSYSPVGYGAPEVVAWCGSDLVWLLYVQACMQTVGRVVARVADEQRVSDGMALNDPS